MVERRGSGNTSMPDPTKSRGSGVPGRQPDVNTGFFASWPRLRHANYHVSTHWKIVPRHQPPCNNVNETRCPSHVTSEVLQAAKNQKIAIFFILKAGKWLEHWVLKRELECFQDNALKGVNGNWICKLPENKLYFSWSNIKRRWINQPIRDETKIYHRVGVKKTGEVRAVYWVRQKHSHLCTFLVLLFKIKASKLPQERGSLTFVDEQKQVEELSC